MLPPLETAPLDYLIHYLLGAPPERAAPLPCRSPPVSVLGGRGPGEQVLLAPDKTLQICEENHLNVLDLPQNLGIGGAVQAGHKYARQFGYDIDVQVDGDGQHDPKYIGALIEKIQAGSDIVVGSRFL